MASPQPRYDNPVPPAHSLRLLVDTQPPHTGWVDGAWWPHSHHLTTELPGLLTVLATRLGLVHHVIYHLDDWDEAPTGFTVGASWVRLGGFHRKPPHTLDVVGLAGSRVALLIVPPCTTVHSALVTMAAAAARGNTSTITDLLRAGRNTPGDISE
ncbi:hypothetical protein KO481_41830 [Nocardia sp. NEAU-G5]|uniref:Uncharacterized protein n=1 Tax=Nocardia albiluteola TaxID=2842303 RepID=A0ABS6BCM4_9NOCA|nr:DUF5994 family protein [Nocardia albiluteola]MBU3068043.1 hypothetical protein [Nocardia albiluteola]